jgi:hypothetical protein
MPKNVSVFTILHALVILNLQCTFINAACRFPVAASEYDISDTTSAIQTGSHIGTQQCYLVYKLYTRDNSVGIATGWTSRVRVPSVQNLSLLHSVQTGSGAHPASYQMGTGDSFPGGKAAEA